ncbi:hypothetical protein EJB05_56933, partial [Eragrostis curvula]
MRILGFSIVDYNKLEVRRGPCCLPNSPSTPTKSKKGNPHPYHRPKPPSSITGEEEEECRAVPSEARCCVRTELADLEEVQGGETAEQRNKFLVLRLYEALNGRDHAGVQALLAPDLEWWFHGPPKHQHMMRILTGAEARGGFRFVPRAVDAFGSTVIAEGHKEEEGTYWVHAWTVGPDGVITQLREYFNTDLTVTRLAAATKCVWQSHRPDSKTNSLPGLVLAI